MQIIIVIILELNFSSHPFYSLPKRQDKNYHLYRLKAVLTSSLSIELEFLFEQLDYSEVIYSYHVLELRPSH